MKASTTVTVVFLVIVALVHLLRFIGQWQVTVDTFVIPMWASAVACVATAALAVWLWSERK